MTGARSLTIQHFPWAHIPASCLEGKIKPFASPGLQPPKQPCAPARAGPTEPSLTVNPSSSHMAAAELPRAELLSAPQVHPCLDKDPAPVQMNYVRTATWAPVTPGGANCPVASRLLQLYHGLGCVPGDPKTPGGTRHKGRELRRG